MFEEYDKLSKKGGMEGAIKSEFSGDIKNGLLTVGEYLCAVDMLLPVDTVFTT